MKKVVFVCLGNICRSPMAEAIFKVAISQENLKLTVDSAGTSSWEAGNPVHSGTRDLLHQHGYDTTGLISRVVTETDFKTADYIIGMDKKNVADLKAQAPAGMEDKVYLYLDKVPSLEKTDIPDPWYTGDFNETYRLIQQGVPYWLAFFKGEA